MIKKFNKRLKASIGLSGKNSGFSLIEVMAAAVILGILFAPLLHAFTTSAKISTKAQKVGEAGDVASNILEVLDTASVRSFWTGGDDITGALGVEPGSITEALPEPAEGEPAPVPADPQTRELEDCTYTVSGIKSGNHTYDAVCTFSTGDTSSANDVIRGIGFMNQTEMVDSSSPDVAFIQPHDDTSNPDKIAEAEYLIENGLTNAMHGDASNIARKRYITIDIRGSFDETDPANKILKRIYLDVTYSYSFMTDNGTYYDLRVSYPFSVTPAGIAPHTDGTPVTAYVMYYANYNFGKLYADNVNPYDDIITVNNYDSLDVRLFLAKQVPFEKVQTAGADTPVTTDDIYEFKPIDLTVGTNQLNFSQKEKDYKLQIVARDPKYAGSEYNSNSAESVYPKDLFTNAFRNIAWDSGTQEFEDGINYGSSYTYGYVKGSAYEHSYPIADLKKLINVEPDVIIYQVVIQVYEQGEIGSSSPIVTISGDKLT